MHHTGLFQTSCPFSSTRQHFASNLEEIWRVLFLEEYVERDHVGDKARVALPEQIKHGLCHAQCVGEENKIHHFLGQSPCWCQPQPPDIFRTKKDISLTTSYRTLHPIQTKPESNIKFSHFGASLSRNIAVYTLL